MESQFECTFAIIRRRMFMRFMASMKRSLLSNRATCSKGRCREQRHVWWVLARQGQLHENGTARDVASNRKGSRGSMLTKVTRLEKLGGFRLRVPFNDGREGVHDFAPKPPQGVISFLHRLFPAGQVPWPLIGTVQRQPRFHERMIGGQVAADLDALLEITGALLLFGIEIFPAKRKPTPVAGRPPVPSGRGYWLRCRHS